MFIERVNSHTALWNSRVQGTRKGALLRHHPLLGLLGEVLGQIPTVPRPGRLLLLHKAEQPGSTGGLNGILRLHLEEDAVIQLDGGLLWQPFVGNCCRGVTPTRSASEVLKLKIITYEVDTPTKRTSRGMCKLISQTGNINV